MKKFILAFVLTGFIASSLALGFSAQRPKKAFCTSDGKGGSVACFCLSYHPDFCAEEGPIPSCCKVTEQGSKAHECHCCGSGMKAATVEERGTYLHIR